MKTIGLTGGIGTGKSTVSKYLKEKDFPIVDADKIAHEITEIGSPVLDRIRGLLGDEVFLEDVNLDRKKVGAMIFTDQQLLSEYKKLTTDEVVRICQEMVREYVEKNEFPAVILDAPLLFECGLDENLDQVWVVDADIEKRIERVNQRDGLPREAILDRINNQMDGARKVERADFVIDNSGDLESLYRQIDKLLERV